MLTSGLKCFFEKLRSKEVIRFAYVVLHYGLKSELLGSPFETPRRIQESPKSRQSRRHASAATAFSRSSPHSIQRQTFNLSLFAGTPLGVVRANNTSVQPLQTTRTLVPSATCLKDTAKIRRGLARFFYIVPRWLSLPHLVCTLHYIGRVRQVRRGAF